MVKIKTISLCLGRGLLIFCLSVFVALSLSCDTLKGKAYLWPAKNPVIDIEYWGAKWRNVPWPERINAAPPELIEYLYLQNKLDGFPDKPTASQPVSEITAALKTIVPSLSLALNKKLEKNLIGIFCVKDLGSSGFTEAIKDSRNGEIFTIIVLDSEVLLKRKANDWAAWKENSIFQPSFKGAKLSMVIEKEKDNTVVNAIRYLLLHELGHALGIISDVHHPWDPAIKPNNLEKYSFVKLSWLMDEGGVIFSRFEDQFPERKKIKFYSFDKAELKNEEMEDVYQHLHQRTNFVSTQAAVNIWEDFAETFVTYVHVVRDGRPWEVRIGKVKEEPLVFGSCWKETRCLEKRAFMDHWYENQ